MPILQSEGGLLVREAELLRFGPHRSNLRRSSPGTHQLDSRIKILTTPLVCIVHRVRGITDSEAAVVAGAVSHIRMEDVVVHRIAWTQHAIRKDMRMWIASLS